MNTEENQEITKGVDYAIKELRDNIVFTINNSKLPASIVGYILRDVLSNVDLAQENALKKQTEEYFEELRKHNEKIQNETEDENNENTK